MCLLAIEVFDNPVEDLGIRQVCVIKTRGVDEQDRMAIKLKLDSFDVLGA